LQTLYDVLGAHPEDDTDGLRAAFRNAAKACHPDNNPDDPGAPQKFRQVVRAYSILKDETQRATYDSLLGEAEQERKQNSRRKVFAEAGLPGPVASMVIASVSIGAFVLLERALAMPVVPKWQDISARVLALSAAMPAQAPETVGRAIEHDSSDKVLPAREMETSGIPEQTAAPVVAATTDNDGAVPAISEPAVKDAKYYLERGNLAYRSGDFPLALSDFDLAISLDPDSSDPYINRAIVFRRMGDLKRALADVNQARSIDEGKRH
jgi:tetratricopeptide (TPR) repeat protein